MNVKTLHGFPFRQYFRASADWFSVNGRGGWRAPQQFSVRKLRSVHFVELRRIDHRAAFSAHGNETGHTEAIKVEREGVGRKVQRGGYCSGRHPLRSRLHKQPEQRLHAADPTDLSQRSPHEGGRYGRVAIKRLRAGPLAQP
jgi:hypothetical protein